FLAEEDHKLRAVILAVSLLLAWHITKFKVRRMSQASSNHGWIPLGPGGPEHPHGLFLRLIGFMVTLCLAMLQS
ncbi:MAG: hypothetical protein AAF840_03775, partial [Bacteroidota bacterium]